MVFHWNLRDSNSPQISRTSLSILSELNNFCLDNLYLSFDFWAFLSLDQSSGGYSKWTSCNWYHCHLHIPLFFSSLSRFRYLSFFSLSFNFTLWFAGIIKSPLQQVLFFCWPSKGLVIFPRLGDLFESQNSKDVCASDSLGRISGCAYTTFVWSKLNILHNSKWITFPTQSCLVLYSFCVNLQHSLIWLIVLSLSPH